MRNRRLLVVVALVLAVVSLVPIGSPIPVLPVAVMLLALAQLV
jgi:hypothetical protein